MYISRIYWKACQYNKLLIGGISNMKYNIMIGVVLLVCLFVFLPTVHADNGKTYKVDSETVDLIDAPSEEATIIAELKKGYKVTIFEDSHGWGKTYYNDKEVWIALNQLTEVNHTEQAADQQDTEGQQEQAAASSEVDTAGEQAANNGQLYRVKVPAVNVRSAPGKDAAVVTQLRNGEKVTIFENSYGWGKTYYNDEEVWIALYLLEEANESTDNETLEKTETRDSQETTEEIENETSEEAPDQKNDEEAVESKDSEEEQTVQAQQNSENPLAGYHFVIDPGHGGTDPGAIGSEINEKTLTLSTAKKLEQQLRNKGASVTLTRTDDTFIPLEERANISNSADTTAFISLHYNSSTDQAARGVETFYYEGGESQTLANSVQASLINHVNINDRGAKQADFQVLKDNNQTAILIELGFISNPEEQGLVQTDGYQDEASKGIIAGLEAYFNG